MEWDDELIGRLRGLWDEGHSTAEIGRRLSVSKNAIVGKAHRLSLPPRPSPIRRGAAEAPRASNRRVVGSTLPPLPAHAPAARKPAASPAAALPVAAPAQAASPPRLPVATAAPLATLARRGARLVCCCWPIGEPGTPSFRFCEAGAVAGKPYCVEHAQLAYVRVRDRRDEAA